MNDSELAAAYLKHYRTSAEEDFWAFNDVVRACNELDRGISLTLALIDLATNDAELAYVAAGPVEDLLKWHGMKAFNLFEIAARKSEKVRHALAGVWISNEREVYPAWKRLMKQYGYEKHRAYGARSRNK